MSNLVKIFNKDGQLVVTSRQVARDFQKEHRNVIRDIEELIDKIGVAQNCADLFIKTEYQHEQNKQWYKEYLLTRDGFSLLVMGFTGKRALEWKLKYIEAFNKMEEYLKSKQAILTNNLSPQLQVLINLELEQKRIKKEMTETRQVADKAQKTAQNIKDVIIQTDKDWRRWINNQMSRMSFKNKDYREKRAESYKFLEERAKCRLKVRLRNLKERLQQAGASKTEINKTNYLDVIGADVRLKEIYTAIVKEMAIKYVA